MLLSTVPPLDLRNQQTGSSPTSLTTDLAGETLDPATGTSWASSSHEYKALVKLSSGHTQLSQSRLHHRPLSGWLQSASSAKPVPPLKKKGLASQQHCQNSNPRPGCALRQLHRGWPQRLPRHAKLMGNCVRDAIYNSAMDTSALSKRER